MRAPLPGRLPRPNGPVELQPEQHLPPASLLAEVHQLQDRRCARCPATDPSAQSRRGARGLCCRYHCCARNTYSVRRDPGSLPHPTTVPRNLPLHPRSSSRGSTFPETDALLAVCGLRSIVGGASILRPPQPLSSHATCWPAAALWRAHLHASPSSCGMAGSAAHRTCERLAIDHLTLLHRATHTLVAQSGVGTAPWTRGTRTRRENPCQASFSRPTGAQSAPLAPPVPPASDGTLRPLRVLLGSRQQRLVAWAGRPFDTAREAAEEALFRR